MPGDPGRSIRLREFAAEFPPGVRTLAVDPLLPEALRVALSERFATPPADEAPDGAILAAANATQGRLPSPRDWLLVWCEHPGYWRRQVGRLPTQDPPPEDVVRLVSEHGWSLRWCATTSDAAIVEATNDGRVLVDGVAVEDTENPGLLQPEWLLLFVRAGYDPLAHAARYADAGLWAQAAAALTPFDECVEDSTQAWGTLQQVRLRYIAAAAEHAAPAEKVRWVYPGMRLYSRLQARGCADACCDAAMASLWRALGDEVSAAKYSAASPDLRTVPGPGPITPPEFTPKPGAPLPRVLFIMPPRTDYGLDVLFDGLCRVLGPENVVDMPFKPSLHGGLSHGFANYPCRFSWPGNARSLRRVLDELASDAYDLIVYGDCEAQLPLHFAQVVGAFASRIPVALVDQRDQPDDARPRVRARLGNSGSFAGYFKRESLACIDFGPDAYPLPFAYSEAYVPGGPATGGARSGVFWAGQSDGGMRVRFLNILREMTGQNTGERFAPAEYAAALARAAVGLNLAGWGFDTVRAWEVPAHGALLWSEANPLQQFHPLVHGQHALYFQSPDEMRAQFAWLQAHPDEVAQIAAAGHAQFLRHHTAAARARQLLGWIFGA